MKKYTGMVLGGLLAAAHLFAAPVVVQSPDGRIEVSFDVKNRVLSYAVSKGGAPIVGASTIEILKGAKMALMDHSVRENDTSWEPIWGQFSTVRDHHNELTLTLTANGMPLKLLCRVFDTGLGFRFVLSEATKGKQLTFTNGYALPEESGYYHPKGEQGVVGPVSRNKLKGVPVPLVLVREDGSALAWLESDIYSAAGFGAMRTNYNKAEGVFYSSSSATSSGAGQLTPWRSILLDQTVGDLTVNPLALNLAAPCVLEDTSWITPGKGLWDWRVHGYDNGDFVYGIDTRSYLRFIDFCSEQGIEYFTVDDHWYNRAKDGKMVVAPEVDIEKVMSYAKEKGVLIKLYYDRKKGNYGDETLFSYYSGLGASAIKYGFMGNKADFTRNAMEVSAENKLLTCFHDGPVPMAGVERTMPNLITREYCHAQQDSRRAFTPETFLKMVTVNALIGPLDMANGNFGLNSINAGERQKGPRKKNSYISTVVSELARTLIVYTGLITLPDAPEEYLKKPDLFQFLKVMPATWDESIVLQSEMEAYLTLARRTGDTWFVGSVNDQSERTLQITLDFLETGTSYEAVLYEDAPDSHGVKNSEAYVIKTIKVKQGDVIAAKMAFGGGHAMILKPVK